MTNTIQCKTGHNERLLTELMAKTGGTYDEVVFMLNAGCDTLEEAQEYISQNAEFESLKNELITSGSCDEDTADEIAFNLIYA